MTKTLHVDTERRWGGGENQLLLLARGMLRRGHEVVIAAHPEGELLRKATALDISCHELSVSGDADASAARRLRGIIRRCRPDIVHMHTAHAHGVGALACVGMRDILRVVSRRVPFPISKGPASLLKYRKGADAYVAVCRAAKKELLAAGVKDNIITIVHSGIDVDAISAVEPAVDLPFGKDAVVVGTAGALVKAKAHHVLVDAAKQISKTADVDIHFAIAGEGPLRKELKTQVESCKIEDRFHLLGHMDDAPAVIRRYDVFVLTSSNEGIPNAVLEAMALSKPVVAFATGGLPEIVVDGRTGILVPLGDTNAFAAATGDLISDGGKRERMGQEGLRRAKEEFSAEGMVDATLSVYARHLEGL